MYYVKHYTQVYRYKLNKNILYLENTVPWERGIFIQISPKCAKCRMYKKLWELRGKKIIIPKGIRKGFMLFQIL